MAEPSSPQLYLVTPPEIELTRFPDQLARILDARDVACVRIALATRDEERLSRAADILRDVTHQRDVAIVVDTHVTLAERLGLDGVHLLDGARTVRAARKALGSDGIVGAFCGTSQHDGMTAGEAGADYVAFGPAGPSLLGDGTIAEPDLFTWWSEMIEIPVVAEGHLTSDITSELMPITDFFAIGEEIWSKDDPLAALDALLPR